MDYRYLYYVLYISVVSQLWPVTMQQPNTPLKKDKLEHIRSIPELSTNIKDPARWKNGTRLIFFYSPWCEHSNSMRSLLYEVIEEVYYRNISGIYVGQIDVSVNSEIARTFRIQSTPTLLLFRNGTRYEFDESHTVEKMVEFISNAMSPSMSEVQTYSQLKELQSHHSVLFLLIYDEEIDKDWERVFTQVSKERILIANFFYTINTDIPTQLGLTTPSLPRLLVLKDKQFIHQYTDTLTKYRMTLWVESEQFPPLPFKNMSTFRPIVAMGNTKRIAVLYVSSITTIPLNQKKAFEAVRRVAEGRKLHSGYQFVVLDDPDLVYGMTGSSDMVFPSLFVWEKKSGLYYLFNAYSQGGFTEKTISAFLFSVTSGKAKESGGPSIFSFNSLSHYYWVFYNLLQAMTSHRPFLSVFSLVCFCLGFSVCVYTKILSKRNQEFKKQLTRRRAIRKKERAKQQQEQELLRRRQQQEDNSNDGQSSDNSYGGEEETDKNK